jgi:WD40 repeat protein
MSRFAFFFALVVAPCVAPFATAGDDLPPGALARLGDDRFRAGGEITRLAISPDGKQFATLRSSDSGVDVLAIWDATTGRSVREYEVNSDLLKGFVWGPGGAFAISLRVDLQIGEKLPKVYPNDFRVWDLRDPTAAPQVLSAHRRGGTPFSAVRWPANSPEYTNFAFSADGRRVASLWHSADGKKYAVHVFELNAADTVAKLKRVGTIDLGAESAEGVRISADGKKVVTFRPIASADTYECTATVWDVASGSPSKPVRTPRDSSYPPVITPDGHELVEGVWTEKEAGYDLVELGTGKRKKLSRQQHPGDENPDLFSNWEWYTTTDCVCFPSGTAFVQPRRCGVAVIDLTTGKELGQLRGHSSAPTAIAVSADGTRLATADCYGLIRLWDTKTLRPLHDAPGHRVPINYAQLSPDGKRVLTWGDDETIHLWDLATGKELRAFAGALSVCSSRGGHHAARPAFTPDGTAILYSTKDSLIARDLQTGLEVPLPGDMKNTPPRLVVFSPDGKTALAWAYDQDNGVCDVWDWPSGKKRFSWKTDSAGFAPGFTSDSSVIYYHAVFSPHRRDAKTGKELPPLWDEKRDAKTNTNLLPEWTRGDELLSLRPAPCWALQYRYFSAPAGESDCEERVIEAGTGKHVSRFRFAHAQGGYLASNVDIALSPVGGQYASTNNHQPDDLYLFESASCTERRVLRGHRGEVRVLGFTPDGTKLLTTGGDLTILVWDMRLQNVPLPDALKNETDAVKLWATLATGSAKDAYLAMARFAREPDAVVKMAKMKLKPATKAEKSNDAVDLADARAIELLEALDTDDARALLKDLAGGHADAFRTQEAKRAIERKKS